MVGVSDLKVYKTTNNLGGAITGTQVTSATPNNVFSNVPKNELTIGEDYYACVYFKNGHATESMDNFKLWLTSKSFPNDTVLKWGFDPANPAQTIADKYTSPTGITWNEVGVEPTAPNVGNKAAGTTFPIWLWLHVNANATARLDDSGLFAFNFEIPQGGTGSPGGGAGGGGSGGTGGNPPPVNTNYKVALAGDWGCESVTDDVISLINTQAYDYVMGVGDNAYSSSSCWINRFTALKNAGKLNSAYGNHEYSESGGISPYKTFFGHSLTYFTKQFQNIFFLVLDTNISLSSGSAQHTFIQSELDRVKNSSTITWRIAVMHHPWFGSSSSHSYNEFNQVQTYHTMFVNGGVNFVVVGHNHNWQRTYQVAYNSSSPTSPTIIDNTSPYSRTAAGLIHVVTGAGGHDSGSSLYSLGSQPSFQAYQNRTNNGVFVLEASNNAQTLTCYFQNTNGDIFDSFTITA